MRIPHVLDLNIIQEYNPSKFATKLLGEVDRKVLSENFEWDKHMVPKLSVLCLQVLADNFQNQQILFQLNSKDQDHILELLSTELDLDIAVPLIEAEYYWRRRYHTHFGSNPMHQHLGWTWKCIYLEHHVRKLIEEAQPQYKDDEMLKPILRLCRSYIHTLHITEVRNWEHPKTLLPSDRPETLHTQHINFFHILEHLPFLSYLEISYRRNNLGINYDKRHFEFSVEDCNKLGMAILHMKHLKVLKLNKNEIEGKHVQVLVRQIMYNICIEELDLSHCKMGDFGAKCLGMMLCVNEKLQILRVKNNGIGPEGIIGIVWGMKSPEGCQLKVLDVSMNVLKHEGCASLLTVLLHGHFPQQVSMAHCSIPCYSSYLIGEMMKKNTSLKKLDISGNVFKEDGLIIMNALKENDHLLSLDVRDTEIPVLVTEKIRELLKRNYEYLPFEMRDTVTFALNPRDEPKLNCDIFPEDSSIILCEDNSLVSLKKNIVTFVK